MAAAGHTIGRHTCATPVPPCSSCCPVPSWCLPLPHLPPGPPCGAPCPFDCLGHPRTLVPQPITHAPPNLQATRSTLASPLPGAPAATCSISTASNGGSRPAPPARCATASGSSPRSSASWAARPTRNEQPRRHEGTIADVLSAPLAPGTLEGRGSGATLTAHAPAPLPGTVHLPGCRHHQFFLAPKQQQQQPGCNIAARCSTTKTDGLVTEAGP